MRAPRNCARPGVDAPGAPPLASSRRWHRTPGSLAPRLAGGTDSRSEARCATESCTADPSATALRVVALVALQELREASELQVTDLAVRIERRVEERRDRRAEQRDLRRRLDGDHSRLEAIAGTRYPLANAADEPVEHLRLPLYRVADAPPVLEIEDAKDRQGRVREPNRVMILQ